LSLGHRRAGKGQAQQGSGQGFWRRHRKTPDRQGRAMNEQCDAGKNEGNTWQFCFLPGDGKQQVMN
jgi:hypothetical protein